MAETLKSPKSPENQNKNPPMATTRVQSPTSPFFLGSNDDQLERAQARAARAAVTRRKAVEVSPPPISRHSLSSNSCLNRDQIIELFHNCVKLASENKINQKNTWELKLIDHLSEIIKEAEVNEETNFQKASCTLEAGVKIYAVRVDAWHADAYRVLSRISRAGFEEEQGTSVEQDGTGKEKEVVRPKKETDKKVSPLSTVESSFEALNVKKFDVAFAVDPLYHQTSSQFDEGGAKGLLLYNLGVYEGCRVLFDSQEVSTKCITPASGCTGSDLIDIFFARDCIEKLVAKMHMEQHISPSLRDITKQLNEQSFPSRLLDGLDSIVNGIAIDENIELNAGEKPFTSKDAIEDTDPQIYDAYDDVEAWSVDHHENVCVSDEGSNTGEDDPMMQNYDEEQGPFMSHEPDMDYRFENVASLLCGGLGYTSIQNRWAGPDHWKYRRPKGLESVNSPDAGLDYAAKRPRSKKSVELDIDFTNYLDEQMPDIFLPAKNPKSLLLPPTKVPSSNTLPEDCHYQPEDLVKLFLLPNIMCLGKRKQRRVSDCDSWQCGNNCDGPLPSWNTEPSVSGLYDEGYIHSDVEEDVLVSQPRQVDKIDVQYDKTSKQVDVHILKETLWNHIQESLQTPEKMHEDALSFRHVLATFPDECQAAATRDISPHLCFICILHLANEHGLTIEGCPNLDDISIHFPIVCRTQVK